MPLAKGRGRIMSSFFKEEYAAALKEQEKLDRLKLRVKADLSVLDTLSLEELLKVTDALTSSARTMRWRSRTPDRPMPG